MPALRKLLVDLDCTLINSEKRLDLEIAVGITHGLSTDQFWQAYAVFVRKHSRGMFTHDRFYECCKEIRPKLNSAIIDDWLKLLEIPFHFPDTGRFLSAFPKEELVILTTGDPSMQRIKIATHNLAPYFSKIMIVPTPKCNSVIDPPPGTFFLDDSPREIDAMKRRHPNVYCIQMRQVAPWEDQKVSECKDAYAEDLTEAAALINVI